MDPPGWAKIKCSWHHCLPGLLLQLLLAPCFSSYLRVSRDKPTWVPELGAPSQATAGPSTRPPLRLLLWTWLFNTPVALSHCSEMWPGTVDCHLSTTVSTLGRMRSLCVTERSAPGVRHSSRLPCGTPPQASAGSGSAWNRPATAPNRRPWTDTSSSLCPTARTQISSRHTASLSHGLASLWTHW